MSGPEQSPGEEGLEERIEAELRALRSEIPGVRAALVATVDGLLVAHDVPDDQGPAQLGALSSTLLALARHALEITSDGRLLEAAIRGQDGYVVAYAVGDAGVLAVLGRADLNVARLHHRTRPVVERLSTLGNDFPQFATLGTLS